jgi:hypothetical protein
MVKAAAKTSCQTEYGTAADYLPWIRGQTEARRTRRYGCKIKLTTRECILDRQLYPRDGEAAGDIGSNSRLAETWPDKGVNQQTLPKVVFGEIGALLSDALGQAVVGNPENPEGVRIRGRLDALLNSVCENRVRQVACRVC